MPADDHRTPGRYAAGLLAAGARPFPFRGGVCRLLGRAAPQAGALRFAPPLPPVGFSYEPPASPGGDPGTGARPGSGDGGVPSGTLPDGPPARLQRTAITRTAATDAEARPVPRPVTAPEAGEPQRADPRENARTTEGDLRVRRTVERPNLAPRSPASEAPEDAPPAGHVGPEQVRMAVPGFTQRRAAFAALSGSDLVAPPERRSEGNAGPPEASGGEGGLRLLSAPPMPGTAEGRAALSGAPGSGASGSGEERSLVRSRVRVAEDVERVRRAVVEQRPRGEDAVRAVAREAAREVVQEAASAERRAPESQARPTSPAPVVVVQNVAGPARQVPRAFWAASALRSAHLRFRR